MAEVVSSFSEALGTVSTQIFNMIGAVVPYILPIVGAILIIGVGIHLVRRFMRG